MNMPRSTLPTNRAFATLAASLISLVMVSACSKVPPTFDKMNLQDGESGIVPPSSANTLPEVGHVTYQREAMSLKAFTRVKLECPQHASRSLTGTEYAPDKIVLCYELLIDAPGQETSLNGACPQDLLLQYEILGLPADVEPKFEVRQGCRAAGP